MNTFEVSVNFFEKNTEIICLLINSFKDRILIATYWLLFIPSDDQIEWKEWNNYQKYKISALIYIITMRYRNNDVADMKIIIQWNELSCLLTGENLWHCMSFRVLWALNLNFIRKSSSQHRQWPILSKLFHPNLVMRKQMFECEPNYAENCKTKHFSTIDSRDFSPKNYLDWA